MAKNLERFLRCSLIGLVLAAAVLYDPSQHPGIRLCLFHWLTGIDCPLCGLTRAVCAAARGHFAESTQFHVLGPAALSGLVVWFFRELLARPAAARAR